MAKEYGTQFESKEWKEFIGEKTEKYETITFEYIAKGNENYFCLGNFKAEEKQGNKPFYILLKYISIKEVPKKFRTK